jgi:hypothetical protein
VLGTNGQSLIASRASIGEEPSNIKRLHGQRSVAACEQQQEAAYIGMTVHCAALFWISQRLRSRCAQGKRLWLRAGLRNLVC